jgi:Mrp family chromosome partitioning ATPase/capsular polysaccharide biosynthesis protein
MESQESRSLGTILWRRKWTVIATIVLALGASIAVSLMTTPKYQASSLLVRQQESIDVALFGTAIIQAVDVERDLATTAEALTSRRIAELVRDSVSSFRSADALLSMVAADPAADSNTITVKVTGSDPREVAQLADEFARQTILLKQEDDKRAVVNARQALETQVALMTPEELESSDGRDLQTRVEQLKILEELQTGGYVLWQSAQEPTNPISPRPLRDGAAGLAVGIILGLIFAVIHDRLDRVLKDQADFERLFRLPTLAVIPRVERKWTQRKSKDGNGYVGFTDTSPQVLEAYRMLRSNLQYFEVEKGLRTILITSGLPQEGKTSTAANLALGLAMSGARVALVDTDLRNPMMHRYLHLDNRVGLSTALAGTARVEDAVQVVKSADFLPQQPGGAQKGDQLLQKNFLCLTSGPLPPNPAELLSSPRAADILRGVKALVDYLLVDSAPVLLVADAVSLAPRVDGVIIVARVGKTTSKQATEIRSILDRVDAPLVGLVLTGVKGHTGRGYGHDYYQSAG